MRQEVNSMTKLDLRACLGIAVLVVFTWGVCALPASCLQPDISGNAAILVSIPSGEVLYQKAAEVKYASPFALKIGLALGIMQCFSGQSAGNFSDRVTDYLVKEFSGKPDLGLADLLTPFVSSAVETELGAGGGIIGIEADLIDVINQAYANSGASMRIQNIQQLRSGTVLTSLTDVLAVTSHLLSEVPHGLSVKDTPSSHNVVLFVPDRVLEVFNNISKVQAEWALESDKHFMAIAQENDLKVIAAVYDSHEADKDAAKLLEYVFSEYRAVKLADKDEVLRTVDVPGLAESIGLVPARDVVIVVSVDEEGSYEMLVKLYEPLTLPVFKGQVIGDLVVLLNGEEIMTVDLLSSKDVSVSSLFDRLWKWFISLIKVL
jgi:D-alanyl-D-alanine carboxypeptidase (penicillin-binding protein 5/6)